MIGEVYMKRRKRKKSSILLTLILLLAGISVGYAILMQDLTINGTSNVKGNTWNVYFDNLDYQNRGNVELEQGDFNATIDNDTLVDVSFKITLKNPGDHYEFLVDVVNDGTVDAMVDSLTYKLNDVEIDSLNPLPSFLDYTVTYSDGGPIQPNDLLEADSSETLLVKVEFKRDVTKTDLPTIDYNLSFDFGVNYIQADSNANAVAHPISFATDSWETIVGAIKSGNTSAYHVGDTKTVELGNSLGTHTIRIANTSTPAECSTTDFSQSACGFVLEFADIILRLDMNSTDTNAGGWPASAMRTYLNDTNDSTSIINSLPSVIKNAIMDTTVVSGHGSTSGETNFTSTDKLYLLSTHEVWEDDDGNTSSHDTAYNNTRQLDYYANIGVTNRNYSGAIKQREGTNSYWWLRSSYSSTTSNFFGVTNIGDWSSYDASTTYGVSPAFRIG